ncbi:MAG: hypothetical protein AAFS10_19060, partial [Myxococcota bacterium]
MQTQHTCIQSFFLSVTLACAMTLTACGDDDSDGDTTASSNTTTSNGGTSTTGGTTNNNGQGTTCTETLDLTDGSRDWSTAVVVLMSDFQTGLYGVVDVAPGCAPSEMAMPPQNMVHSDAVGRVEGGLVYVINRLGADNVQILDPASSFATVAQWSVGNGTNPQDIAFQGDTSYVSLYGSVELGLFDPDDGTAKGTIDLSAFA